MSPDLIQTIKQGSAAGRKRLGEIDAEIAKLLADRLAILKPPFPISDVKQFAKNEIDRLAKLGQQEWARSFLSDDAGARYTRYSKPQPSALNDDSDAMESYLSGEQMPALNPVWPLAGPGTQSPVSLGAICAMFGDAFKDGVDRIVDEAVAPKWPKDVGLPRAERLVKCRELTKKIDELEAERGEINALLKAAVGAV